MKVPKRIEPLIDEGMIDEVVRQLMSGKEANVYVVRCGDELRCAKVYKDAEHRSFSKSVNYQEGRRVKNSRQSRAMAKGTRFGRKMQEEVWQNAEVDALYRLAAAGVSVPKPHVCYEGVLVMELVTDADDMPAPRLNDVSLTEAQAMQLHAEMLHQVVIMLCAGIIHGDLSEYNVLLGRNGLVIIDLPQAVNAAGNLNASVMLERDVANLASYFGRFAPELLTTQYGKEIWRLYESGKLKVDTELTGKIALETRAADVAGVLAEVNLAIKAEEARRLFLTGG